MDSRTLGRYGSHRMAMLSNMAASLFLEESITTTVTRAKEVRPLAEKMITLGKRGDLNAKRQAFAFIPKEAVVKKTFDELAPKYATRNGGYTRITRIGPRRGDGAEMAIIELV
ncbi:MAG: 50S ribosomal protein L17 [Clostridia bacterium]|nr:50S ribosomal protein L17 [Clostridia bacterium]